GGNIIFWNPFVSKVLKQQIFEYAQKEKVMFCTKNLIAMAVAIVALTLLIPVAQAETPFDFNYCGSSTTMMVSEGNELSAFGLNGKGTVSSNHENKVFNNFSYQFVAVVKVVDGKRSGIGYTKYTDPDGDTIVQEFVMSGTESSIQLIQGSGKWKGINGTGKSVPITDGRPTPPGTTCRRIVGVFEIVK
ncbi:MAG TPA: hypothetical protein VLS90_10170, partial [Thermodesulfobacteriota bacterium]|nr:hypothetical protein [Thermodesulfobacteriota bacterium]